MVSRWDFESASFTYGNKSVLKLESYSGHGKALVDELVNLRKLF